LNDLLQVWFFIPFAIANRETLTLDSRFIHNGVYCRIFQISRQLVKHSRPSPTALQLLTLPKNYFIFISPFKTFPHHFQDSRVRDQAQINTEGKLLLCVVNVQINFY